MPTSDVDQTIDTASNALMSIDVGLRHLQHIHSSCYRTGVPYVT